MRWSSWLRGTRTVVSLELRQQVRSRRWWVVLVVWTALIGVFTLLMTTKVDDTISNPFDPSSRYMLEPDGVFCDSYQVGLRVGSLPIGPQTESVDGCQLTFFPLETVANSARTVCSADDDGQVRCRVVEWVTQDKTCYDIGAGPVCFRYDPNTGPVPAEGSPPPDPGFDCTNTDDGSAVCHLPAQAVPGGGVVYLPSQTCTVSYLPDQRQYWDYSDYQGSCVWDSVDGWTPNSGPFVFGAVVFLVLALGLLVTPALTAGAINGDRQAGTMATLQATPLTATQIVSGKLVSAWLTMAAFLVTALPWITMAAAAGGASVLQVIGCCTVLMVELAVMCAVGLGWSALFSRASASNLLSYGTALTLSVLTVVLNVLLIPLTERDVEVEVWRLPHAVQSSWLADLDAYYSNPELAGSPPTPPGDCSWFPETQRQTRTDLIWWLLVPNPFVMVADISPEPEIARTHPEMYDMLGNDPLFQIRSLVTKQAAGPARQIDDCGNYDYYREPPPPSPVEEPSGVRVWPWSLAANLLLGAGFFTIAVRRLKIPYRKLPRGTRVA